MGPLLVDEHPVRAPALRESPSRSDAQRSLLPEEMRRCRARARRRGSHASQPRGREPSVDVHGRIGGKPVRRLRVGEDDVARANVGADGRNDPRRERLPGLCLPKSQNPATTTRNDEGAVGRSVQRPRSGPPSGERHGQRRAQPPPTATPDHPARAASGVQVLNAPGKRRKNAVPSPPATTIHPRPEAARRTQAPTTAKAIGRNCGSRRACESESRSAARM